MSADVGFHVPGAKQEYAGLIDRSGRFVVPPIYDWIRRRPGGFMQVKFGERFGYIDASGRPVTFSDKDIEQHIATTRERLKPPPPPAPGRAISARAGDTEYHLILPEGICALDSTNPADRRLIESMRSSADSTQPRSGGVETEPQEAIGGMSSKLFAYCEELERFRSSGERQVVRTLGSAAGLQKDRYDPSLNAVVYMRALLCGRLQGDLAKGLRPDEPSARIWAALKKLEAGEPTALPGIAQEPLACYSAWMQPAAGSAQPPAQAKVSFQTLLLLPDWQILISTPDTLAASPEPFLAGLEHAKSLSKALQGSNLRK